MTVWGQRISPVFDSARTLLIAEIDGSTVVGTVHLAFNPERPLELVHILRAQQIVLVICGAVSAEPAIMLEAAGIELISFIAGDVRQILERYLQGQPFGAEFRMPGCGKNICCRGKIRRGQEIGGRQSARVRAARTVTAEHMKMSFDGADSPEQSGDSWSHPCALPVKKA